MPLRPFPWAALERVSRREAAALSSARQRVSSALDTEALSRAASAMLGVPVELSLRGARLSQGLPPPLDVRLFVDARGDGADMCIDLEAGLAQRIASALLGKPAPSLGPRGAVPPELEGAAAAFIVLCARRSLAGSLARLSAPFTPRSALVVTALALVGDDAFEIVATVREPGPTAPQPFDRGSLARLGHLPLSLHAVAAVCALGRDDLSALDVGAGLAPGASWRLAVDRAGRPSGRVSLLSPTGEQGLVAEVDGASCGQARLVLTADASASPQGPSDPMNDPSQQEPDVAEALGDAPVVVRVELATVTLEARAWASIRPGDVLSTGVRLGEPVVLRSGGVVIARGELCDLDGELAVRITERKGAEP